MKRRAWTHREELKLKEEYPEKRANELADDLNRSRNAIYLKASKMGIKSKKCGLGTRWTQDEIGTLKEGYSLKTTSKLAEDLDRTRSSVKSKIESMGLGKKSKLNKSEEIEVRELYQSSEHIKTIAEKKDLPVNLVREAICHKELLEKLYYEERLSQEEIGNRLGVSQSHVSERMRKHGIITRAHKPWTEEEEIFLENNYLKTPKEELLSLLPRRNWGAIKSKALKLSVARPAEEYRKSKEVKDRLRTLAKENIIQIDFGEKEALAYILGVIDGDGFHDKKYTIGLEVKSKEFADKFYEALKKVGLRPGRGTRMNEERETVWASSKQLITWCVGMDNEEKIGWLMKNALEWRYIEGRYESDGNIHSCGSPCICSTDKTELRFLHTLLSTLGIKCSIQKDKVWVSSHSREEFFKNINPVLRKERKAQSRSGGKK